MSLFTKKLTGASTLSIVKEDGFNWIAIGVSTSSTANATILGTNKLGDGTISEEADILIGQSLTIDTKGQYPIEFILTIPSGCVVNIIAN